MSDTNTPAESAEMTSLDQLVGGMNEPEAPAGTEGELNPAPAPSPEPEPAPAAASPAPAAPNPDQQGPKWYRDAITARDRRLADKDRELEILRQRVQAPGPAQQQPAALPDPLDDPQGYHGGITQYVQQEVARARFEMKLEMSETVARQKHGDELFDEAEAWLHARPDVAQWAAQHPSPWLSAIQAYQREKLASEIGDDPNAWREAERERLKQELLAEMTPADPGAQPHRPAIPAPASQHRSAAPRAVGNGPAPLSSLTTNRF